MNDEIVLEGKKKKQKMGVEAEAETKLKPRDYQNQILDVCLKKNTIIYLPTGAGKTFIAMMAIKFLATDLDKYERVYCLTISQ